MRCSSTRASFASKSLTAASDPHRQVLHAVDEGGAQPLRRARDLDVREAPEQLLEHHPHLLAREARAEAEVLADAEREVLVGIARDVEAVRIREDRLVA